MSTTKPRSVRLSEILKDPLTAPIAAFVVLSAGAAYTALANPYLPGFFPGCPLLASTGHWCPGCGGLRATHELLHGDLGAAMGLNPVVVVVIVPLIILAMGWWLLSAAGVQLPKVRISTGVAWILPAVLGVFWVARNIPALEPWLAP